MLMISFRRLEVLARDFLQRRKLINKQERESEDKLEQLETKLKQLLNYQVKIYPKQRTQIHGTCIRW